MRIASHPPLTAHVLLFFIYLAPCCICANSLQVTWISPAGGDTYPPSSYLVGRWIADEQVTSPTFKLCNAFSIHGNLSGPVLDDDDGDNCGGSVQPSVQIAEDGSYRITLAIPNLTVSSSFQLVMEDGSGGTCPSPTFAVSSLDDLQNTTASVSSSLNNGTSSITDPSPTNARSLRPHRSISPAAYAVPLSIAGLIVVFATVIGLHHRRKLVTERSLQSEDFKTFKSQFTDNLGRLRGLSMWATQLATNRPHGKTMMAQKPEIDDIFTPVYVPNTAHEKHGPKRLRSTTREPFCPRRNGMGPVFTSVSKAAASPRIPYALESSPGATQLRHLHVVVEEEESKNAAANDVSHYLLQPSPMPLLVPTPLKAAYLKTYGPGTAKSGED
ncbi:hypothetical protein BC835DRAFT_1413917 [Cytidiella melzeri]|nr:hypothetical protein BC835DRAFT_1413917 [Cytidiella melzeri]